jgi:hypothetical protein
MPETDTDVTRRAFWSEQFDAAYRSCSAVARRWWPACRSSARTVQWDATSGRITPLDAPQQPLNSLE